MNQQTFEQEIIQTLELCLSKMSQKLKSSFDPIEKLSIQLLQQFRSTISTYHTCLKKAGKVLDNINNAKQNTKPAHNKTTNQIEHNKELFRLEQKAKENDQEIDRLMKRLNIKTNTPPAAPPKPSGLLCIPG